MRLIYFADPMCSWCWGFSPVIGAVAEQLPDLPIDVVMGGLRPGTTEPMTDAMKEEIRGHWQHVHEASGQPFDFSFFERQGFVYDTEPACRAVVTARGLEPGRTLDVLARVQAAFYRDNLDVTATARLLDIAQEAGFDRETFAEHFDDAHAATRADFEMAAHLGVRGFPALVGDDGSRLFALTSGFQSYERLLPTLTAWVGLPDP